MSANGATISGQGSSYVHDGILYQRVSEQDCPAKPQRLGFATSLSQGLTTGALMIFAWTVGILLDYNQSGYNFRVVSDFPFILCYGLVPGLVEGLVIWICTRVAGHYLLWPARLLIAGLIPAIPYGILILVMVAVWVRGADIALLLAVVITVGAIGAIFGILTGSRFSPLRQLVRGDDSLPAGSWFAAGLTGFVLRIAVVFFLMESVLAFIITSQASFVLENYLWSLALLLHFVFAFAIVFAKLKFWLLLPFALVINAPIVFLMQNYLLKSWDVMLYLCVGYLAAWAIFLIVRCPLTYWCLDFLKEEFNYYLFD